MKAIAMLGALALGAVDVLAGVSVALISLGVMPYGVTTGLAYLGSGLALAVLGVAILRWAWTLEVSPIISFGRAGIAGLHLVLVVGALVALVPSTLRTGSDGALVAALVVAALAIVALIVALVAIGRRA